MISLRFENIHYSDLTVDAILGPFEWVQLTHEVIRISPDGETIAYINDGNWYIHAEWRTSGEAKWFTNVVIYQEDI